MNATELWSGLDACFDSMAFQNHSARLIKKLCQGMPKRRVWSRPRSTWLMTSE